MTEQKQSLGFGTFILLLVAGAWLTHGLWGDTEESPATQRARASDAARNAREQEEDPTGEKRRQKDALMMTMSTMGDLSQYYRQMKSGDLSASQWRSEFRVYLSFCTDAGRAEDLCRKMALSQMVKDGVPAQNSLAIALGLGDQL